MPSVERPPAIIACLLFVLLSACKPKEWTAVSRATPNASTATPIWVNVVVTSQKDNFRALENLVFEQRFAALSNHISTYTGKDLLFTLTPTSNGDHTISIAATLREHAHPATAISSVTAVDGKEIVHQVGQYRFTFLVTTDPRFFSIVDTQTADRDRISGVYVQSPGRFSGVTLILDRGRVTFQPFSDTGGPQPATQGRYTMKDERVFFEGGRWPMTHLVIDHVDVLMDLGDPTDHSNGGCFIRIPKELEGDENWWKKLLEAHPQFAKALPH